MLVRGIVLGGLSASGLSLLMVGAVALVAPPPGEDAQVRRSDPPAAPQAAAPGVAPETLPAAPPTEAPAQVADTEVAPSTGVDLPAGSQFGRGGGQQLATPSLPQAGPSRTTVTPPPEAPSVATDGFTPETQSASQPEIAVAVAPVSGPVATESDPAAPAPVVEGAPTTFRTTGLSEGNAPGATDDPESASPNAPTQPTAVVEVPGGTLEPTQVGDDQAPPAQRPERAGQTDDAPTVVAEAPTALGTPGTGEATPDAPREQAELARLETDAPASPEAVAAPDAPAIGTTAPTPSASGAGESAEADPTELAGASESPPEAETAVEIEERLASETDATPDQPETRNPSVAVDTGTAPEAAPAQDGPAVEISQAVSDDRPAPEVGATSAGGEVELSSVAPNVTEASPTAPRTSPTPSDAQPPATELATERDVAVSQAPAADLDAATPDASLTANAEPAAPVEGATQVPQAPETLEMAEAGIIAPQSTTVPDRLIPTVPGQQAPATDTPRVVRTPEISDQTGAETGAGAVAETGGETVGETGEDTNRIRPISQAEIITPPAREEVGPAPEPIVPRIITPGQPRRIQLENEAARAEDPQPTAPQVQQGDARAISRNAASFEADGARPLFGIVLVDDGKGVSPANLAAIDFPITFALDALDPTSPERARAYREAGQEVVLLADALPEGGTPQDIEIALAGAMQALPQAVAILDTPDRRLAKARQSLPALADSGHGLVAYPGGLGSAVNEARRAGVPAAQLYRLLDEDDERATVITRYLDRATFEALQSGNTIVVGRARPETITAIYSWRLGDRAENVEIAPLSAVLLSEQE